MNKSPKNSFPASRPIQEVFWTDKDCTWVEFWKRVEFWELWVRLDDSHQWTKAWKNRPMLYDLAKIVLEDRQNQFPMFQYELRRADGPTT
jgi:hypothetical protein